MFYEIVRNVTSGLYETISLSPSHLQQPYWGLHPSCRTIRALAHRAKRYLVYSASLVRKQGARAAPSCQILHAQIVTPDARQEATSSFDLSPQFPSTNLITILFYPSSSTFFTFAFFPKKGVAACQRAQFHPAAIDKVPHFCHFCLIDFRPISSIDLPTNRRTSQVPFSRRRDDPLVVTLLLSAPSNLRLVAHLAISAWSAAPKCFRCAFSKSVLSGAIIDADHFDCTLSHAFTMAASLALTDAQLELIRY